MNLPRRWPDSSMFHVKHGQARCLCGACREMAAAGKPRLCLDIAGYMDAPHLGFGPACASGACRNRPDILMLAAVPGFRALSLLRYVMPSFISLSRIRKSRVPADRHSRDRNSGHYP